MIDWNFLSDPSYKPPEGLLDLNLKVDFKGLLDQFDKKTLARFAISEAKLVLPIFEAEHPTDNGPRRAIESAESWLTGSISPVRIVDPVVAGAATNAIDAATNAIDAATWAARAAVYADNTASYWAESTAYWARRANFNVNIEDQIKRLFSKIERGLR